MKVAALGALIICAFTVQAAFAQATLGNDLYSACQGDDLAQKGFCVGYLQGVIEGLRLGAFLPFAAVGDDMSMREKIESSTVMLGACIPEEASLGQNLDIVMAYMRENPSTRHNPARGEVLEALRLAFPCP